MTTLTKPRHERRTRATHRGPAMTECEGCQKRIPEKTIANHKRRCIAQNPEYWEPEADIVRASAAKAKAQTEFVNDDYLPSFNVSIGADTTAFSNQMAAIGRQMTTAVEFEAPFGDGDTITARARDVTVHWESPEFSYDTGYGYMQTAMTRSAQPTVEAVLADGTTVAGPARFTQERNQYGEFRYLVQISPVTAIGRSSIGYADHYDHVHLGGTWSPPSTKRLRFEQRRDPLSNTLVWSAWMEEDGRPVGQQYAMRTSDRDVRDAYDSDALMEHRWGRWITETSEALDVDQAIWPTWAEMTNRQIDRLRVPVGQTGSQVIRNEERRARDAEAARAREAERRREDEAAKEAEERAEALLMETLDEIERSRWEKDKVIRVRSSKGKTFEIKKGRAHNVYEVDAQGRRIVEYCAHARSHVPDADNVLAQKLAIENDEDEFTKVANRVDLISGNDLGRFRRDPARYA